MILRQTLRAERDELRKNNVRLDVIGRAGTCRPPCAARSRRRRSSCPTSTGLSSSSPCPTAAAASWSTRCAGRSRSSAARRRRRLVDEDFVARHLYTAGLPDPDLLIRTSGEMRLSNFMLWQLAYTELWITETLWPDFRRRHLYRAVRRLPDARASLRSGRLSLSAPCPTRPRPAPLAARALSRGVVARVTDRQRRPVRAAPDPAHAGRRAVVPRTRRRARRRRVARVLPDDAPQGLEPTTWFGIATSLALVWVAFRPHMSQADLLATAALLLALGLALRHPELPRQVERLSVTLVRRALRRLAHRAPRAAARAAVAGGHAVRGRRHVRVPRVLRDLELRHRRLRGRPLARAQPPVDAHLAEQVGGRFDRRLPAAPPPPRSSRAPWFAPYLSVRDAAAIGVLVGLFAQVGDFVESLLKRDAQHGDSSDLIPGHGGVLDRFDSLYFGAPIVYYYLKLAVFQVP